jgi:hypothetical protein
MKKAGKMLAAALAGVLILLALTGCGDGREESAYVGSWELESGKANSVTLQKDQIQEQLGEVSFSIQEDGTVEKTGIGLDADGVWKETENGITVSDRDESNAVSFVYDSGRLTGTVKGLELVFAKKE